MLRVNGTLNLTTDATLSEQITVLMVTTVLMPKIVSMNLEVLSVKINVILHAMATSSAMVMKTTDMNVFAKNTTLVLAVKHLMVVMVSHVTAMVHVSKMVTNLNANVILDGTVQPVKPKFLIAIPHVWKAAVLVYWTTVTLFVIVMLVFLVMFVKPLYAILFVLMEAHAVMMTTAKKVYATAQVNLVAMHVKLICATPKAVILAMVLVSFSKVLQFVCAIKDGWENYVTMKIQFAPKNKKIS